MAPRRPYRRLLGYLAPYWAWVGLALCASGLSALAAAAYAYLLGPLFRALMTEGPLLLGPLELPRADLALTLPALLLGVAAVKAGCQWLQGGLMQRTGQQVMGTLRGELYGKLLSLPPSYHQSRHSGELLSRLTADVGQVEFAVTQALSSYAKDGFQVLAQLLVCAALDGRLFVLAFVVLPGAVIPIVRFARSLKKIAGRTQGSLGQLSQLAAEQLHNSAIVQAYGGAPRALARFDAEQARYAQSMKRSLLLRGAFTPTLEVMGIAAVALALGVGARAVRTEPELAAKLISFLAASLLMYQPLKALSGTFSLVSQGLGSAARLFEVLDVPAPKDGTRQAPPLSRGVRFEDVRLRYASGQEALRGLTLEVPAGKHVALVGPSGGGKSTAMAVLLRLVTPTGGRVLWDGEDLVGTTAASVRSQLAWVPQEPVLFSGTLRDNLLLARPKAAETELWDALRRAHADAFVRALPRGLNEPVGERGALLSGGQRQRLAIARALLRRPRLLLLDEPTSALDSASEREVQLGLEELMRGRTTLVVAHRLSTIRRADFIYVLDEGRVVEAGTHDELVERGGRYLALLHPLQAEAVVA